MPSRRPSSAEQRNALDAARARLKDNDIDGYWTALEKQDSYAGLARDVAANRGKNGEIANTRLDRFVREARGRDLDDAERAAIRREIAAADLAQRERNLAETGDHRVTGPQSVEYHRDVFEARGIPKEAYFPTRLQPAIGSIWGLPAGIHLRDAPDFPSNPTDVENWKQIFDGMQRDVKPISDRYFREELAERAKTLPSQGLMEIEGFHGNPQNEALDAQHSDASASFESRLSALPPAPERWLDFTLSKQPADLSRADLHTLQAHDAYLKPQHPRHDDAFRLVSDTYRHLYGDAAQDTDATGRPLRGMPQRDLPEQSRRNSAETRREDTLRAFGRELDDWYKAMKQSPRLLGEAGSELVKLMQDGLNDLLWPDQPAPRPQQAARGPYRGGPLLVDGDLGPVTAQALDRAEAEGLLPPLQDEMKRSLRTLRGLMFVSPPLLGLPGDLLQQQREQIGPLPSAADRTWPDLAHPSRSAQRPAYEPGL
ncbi:MAG: hypothetical protein ACK4FJ_05805 [Ferrovibrio sp.]|uniref:hypothetical protein n=1 Tax=Ferrovibrio sp. TaxID=1917215 RepID=UPI00391C61D7